MAESKTTRADIFKTLSAVNVSPFVEKKMGLKYLSWANAWAILMKYYPETKEPTLTEYDEYEIDPNTGRWYATGRKVKYLKTSAGVTVESHIIIAGFEYSAQLYVMDNRNRVVKDPDAALINKTQQRCFVKALAYAGLGLNLYQGEDLPTDENLNQKTMKQSKQFTQQSKKPVQQKQVPVKKEQMSSQQIVNQATKEFNDLKRQLMEQQGLSEEEIRNIAKEAADGITDKVNRLSAGNKALRKKLKGELVNA